MDGVHPTDAEMVPLGERLADAIRAVLNDQGSGQPAWKLMGEVIDSLNRWDEAMQERFNHDVRRH